MSQANAGAAITINIVKGGYVLSVDSDEGSTEEVFMSTAKLNKAVRTAIDTYTLIPKTKADAAEADAE
jgi:hypothetical protein